MLATPMKVRDIREWDMPDLPAKLKSAAASSGKSVVQICGEAGISTAFWYEVLKGNKSSITLPTLRAIEAALDVDLGVKFDA